jgi:hypothetical protein
MNPLDVDKPIVPSCGLVVNSVFIWARSYKCRKNDGTLTYLCGAIIQGGILEFDFTSVTCGQSKPYANQEYQLCRQVGSYGNTSRNCASSNLVKSDGLRDLW